MSTKRLIIEQATGLAALLLFVAISIYLAPLKPNIVELQLAFGPAAFQRVIELWQAEGVRLFRSHFVADFALLACYGVNGYLFASRTSLFQRYSQAAKNSVVFSMPFAAVCDAIENCLHLYFTAPGTSAASVLYPVSATCSTLKFVLILIYLGNILWAAICQRKVTAND